MTMMEAIKEQWSMMKKQPPKERISYFLHYYGFITLCIIIVVAVLINYCVHLLTQTDPWVNGVFFNSATFEHTEQYLQDFSSDMGLDPKKEAAVIQTNFNYNLDSIITEETYQSAQVFLAMMASQEVDVEAAHMDLLVFHAYLGYLTDLRDHLPQQQLEALEPYLYYVDGYLIELDNQSDQSTFQYGVFPDPTKPEEMTDPIPVAIMMDAATEEFTHHYMFTGEGPAIGICASSARKDNALALIQYIFDLPIVAAPPAA